MSDVEIRTELTLQGIEDLKAALVAVKDQILNADAAREKTQRGFGEWLSTAHQLAGVLGVSVSSVVERVRGMGAAFVDAGSSAETGDHAIAAMMMSASGYSAGVAIDAAQELGGELDRIAVSAGVAGAAVEDALQVMIERGDASAAGIQRATEDVEKLATISGKLGKNTGAIAGEYALMLEGQLRVKGQLFQLLQGTGTFGDNAKKAAEGWALMTEGQRAEVLERGLDKLSSKMKAMPPTFAQASASFDNMVRLAKEDVGQPIVEELTPALRDLAKDFQEFRPDIAELGRLLAKEVGGGVREGGKAMKEALAWIRENKGALVADMKGAAVAVKDAFAFVLAHKEEIAVAFGVKALAGSGAISAIGKGGKAVGQAAAWATNLDGGTVLGKQTGSAGAIVAAAGAISIWTYNVEQGTVALKEYNEHRKLKSGGEGGMKGLGELAGRGDVEGVRNVTRVMRELDEAAGRSSGEMNGFYRSMNDVAEMSRRVREISSDSDKKKVDDARRAALDIDAMSGFKNKEFQDQMAAGANFQVQTLLAAYNVAMKGGDQGMALLAAQALASGQVVGQAFLKTNADVQGGLEAMAELLLSSGSQFAGFAQSLKGKAAGPAAPIFMPGAKITVNQDFRNKDPDAVAIAFKRDIARAAERRSGARYSGVFG
jgi:hypothetical protein